MCYDTVREPGKEGCSETGHVHVGRPVNAPTRQIGDHLDQETVVAHSTVTPAPNGLLHIVTMSMECVPTNKNLHFIKVDKDQWMSQIHSNPLHQ